MTKRMVIMLVAVALVFGGVFGFQAFKAAMIKKFMSTMAQPPQTVTAGKANASEWQPKITAVGSLRAVSGADLSLEVSGVVDVLAFNSVTMWIKGRHCSNCVPTTMRPSSNRCRPRPISTRSPMTAT